MAALQSICIDGFCSEVDLSNYYTKTQVDSLIDAIATGGFEVVDELPATGEDKIIYLVPNEGSAPNIYDEYIYVNNAWEKIGTTEMDLSNYYNKTEVDDLLDDKQDTLTPGDNISITNNTISATYSDATTDAAGLMSAADKTKLDGITAGAEPNQDAYATVKVGNVEIDASQEQDTIELEAGTGVTLTPDASGKKVTVAVSLTKAQLLEILGYEEVTFSKTDAAGTISGVFLGSAEQTPAGD